MQYTVLPHIASYLASKDKNTADDYNRYIDQGTWIYVGRAITFVLGNILAAKLTKCLNGRISILIGDIIISGSIAVTYFTVNSLVGMIVTYGILSGIGCGISYVLPMSIAIKWFPRNQAFVAGVILSGYGLSAVVFNVVITRIINPHNIELDPDTGFLNQDKVLDNIPSSFWKVGLIYFSMQMIGLLLIREVPNEQDQDNNIITKGENQQQTNIIDDNDNDNMTYSKLADQDDKEINMTALSNHSNRDSLEKSNANGNDNLECSNKCSYFDTFLEKHDLKILKQGIFWNLWFTTFFSQMTLIYFSSQWKTFTNQQLELDDDVMLSYMGSFSSIANASGRVFWGFLRDRSRYIKTMSCMTVIDSCLLATWPLLIYIFTSRSVLTLFANIWIAGIFFCQIGIYNIMVQRLSELYGVDKVNYYHGLLITNQIPAAIISALVVVEMRLTLGWIGMSLVMASFQFIAFCIVLSSRLCK